MTLRDVRTLTLPLALNLLLARLLFATAPGHFTPVVGVGVAQADCVQMTQFSLDSAPAADALCSEEREPRAAFDVTVTEGETRSVLKAVTQLAIVVPGRDLATLRGIQVTVYARSGKAGYRTIGKGACGDLGALGLRPQNVKTAKVELLDKRGCRIDMPALGGRSSSCFKVSAEVDASAIAKVRDGRVKVEVVAALGCRAKHAHSRHLRKHGGDTLELLRSSCEFRQPAMKRVNANVLLGQLLFSRPKTGVACADDLTVESLAPGKPARCGRIGATSSYFKSIRATGRKGTCWKFRASAGVRFSPGACGSTSLGISAFLVGDGCAPAGMVAFKRQLTIATSQLLGLGCGPVRHHHRRHRRGHHCHCGSTDSTPPTTGSTGTTPPSTGSGDSTPPTTSTTSSGGTGSTTSTEPTTPVTEPPTGGTGATIETGDFVTYTQGGWGTVARGNNPGTIRDAGFATAFPAGLTIGTNPAVTFTSSAAIEEFLPQGGTAGTLTESAIDPSSAPAGVLGGQLVAATLNAAYSAAGLLSQNDPAPLGSLTIATGIFSGYSVDRLLSAANAAISGDNSGLPPGATLSDLNDALTSINECFDNGSVNTGYLRKP